MVRGAFLVTPFVDIDTGDVMVTLHSTGSNGPSVVLSFGVGVMMHVYDQVLVERIAEVAIHGRDLLTAAMAGQDVLPVDESAV